METGLLKWKRQFKLGMLRSTFLLLFVTILGLFLVFYAILNHRDRSHERTLEDHRKQEIHLNALGNVLEQNIAGTFQNTLLYQLNGKELHRYNAIYSLRKTEENVEKYRAEIQTNIQREDIDLLITKLIDDITTFHGLATRELSEDGKLPELSDQSGNLVVTTDSVFDQSATGLIPAQSTFSSEDPNQLIKKIKSNLHDISISVNKFYGEAFSKLQDEDNADILWLYLVLLLILSAVASYLIKNSIRKSVESSGAMLTQISKGELPEKLASTEDEFNVIVENGNALIDYLGQASSFTKAIGEGNFDFVFQSKGDEDELGNALLEMRSKLQKVTLEDHIRNWNNEGHAKFGDILRQHNNNLDELGDQLIAGLVNYLKASQGAIFISNEDDKDTPYLSMLSAYAYNRKKFFDKRVEMGEGLVGQTFLERKTTYIKDVKEDHFDIITGLGESRPSCILIVPLKDEEIVEGVLEISSLNELKEYEITFVERVAESIASSLRAGKINQTTKNLLEETQQKAEEMKAQEEELRQNMEELAATQEQVERLRQDEAKAKAEIEQRQQMMINVLNEIPAKVFVKDKGGHLILLNQAVADAYNTSIDQLLGTTDFDYFSKEDATQFRADEIKMIESGQEYFNPEEVFKDKEGNTHILRSKKIPFYISYLDQTGILGVQIDITDMKNLQEDLQKEKYLLDQLLDSTVDMIYFKDQDSKFIRGSKALAERLEAKDIEDIIGKSDFDFFGKEHAQQAFDYEQRIIKTGRPIINLVEKENWEDGRIAWVSTNKNPLLDHEGKVIGTFGISRDITETKLAEVDVIKQKEWIAEFFRNSKQGFVVLNQAGKINYASPEILKQINKNTHKGLYLKDLFISPTLENLKKKIHFEKGAGQRISIQLIFNNEDKSSKAFICYASDHINEDNTRNIFLITA